MEREYTGETLEKSTVFAHPVDEAADSRGSLADARDRGEPS
jgi:hypothetical protein